MSIIVNNNRQGHQQVNRQKVNLIGLPYAGGSTNYFEPIKNALQGKLKDDATINIQMIEVSLPGRGVRYNEPLLDNIDDLVADIWKQIQHLTYQPYAFLGHSMGSLLTYLLTHKAKKAGVPLPVQLFLSGREGPSSPPDGQNRYLSSRTDLKTTLRDYGGINAEILENDDIFSFFEPIIRADFKIVETWKYCYRPQLNIPTIVLTGTKEDITAEERKAWQKEFQNEIEYREYEGGHFFIYDHADSIAALIVNQLQVPVYAAVNT